MNMYYMQSSGHGKMWKVARNYQKTEMEKNMEHLGKFWKFLWKPKWKWATSICEIAVGWEFSSKTMSPTDFQYALKSAFFLPPSMETAYTSKSATFMRTYIKLTPHVLKGCHPCRRPQAQNNKNTDIESLMYRICWLDQLSWEHSQQFFIPFLSFFYVNTPNISVYNFSFMHPPCCQDVRWQKALTHTPPWGSMDYQGHN